MTIDQAVIAGAVAATRAAGETIMGYFQARETYVITDKDNNTPTTDTAVNNPLTDADLAADELLHTRLLALLPEAGWLSEETVDSPERLNQAFVWVVDPLDGTREFVMGIPEFTVSVALVELEQVVLGIIYNPATDELYVGMPGQGATLNGAPVAVSGRQALPGAAVDASRSERKRGEFAPVEDLVAVRTMGSIALKLARVAAGQCDATWSRGPKNEWDICAGVGLIQAAGGTCVDLFDQPIRFNQPQPQVPGIIGDNGRLHGEIVALLSALGAARTGDQRA